MSEMVERVAAAMFESLANQESDRLRGNRNDETFGFCGADNGLTILDGAYDLQAAARAAIEAMGEPTDAMCEAGVRQTWWRMIDSALKE